ICSIATIGQYVWSMRAHFQLQGMSPGAMAISAVVIATALFFLATLWIQSKPVPAKLAGLAVELASSVLFWWAIVTSRRARLHFAFAPDNPHSLLTDGPYRYKI
ncbi:isoprenylcysteine carboxylmethyltransferase family protein, partial [Mesorhizobium sp. M2D.F.Ca.ET.223.01.1.1]